MNPIAYEREILFSDGEKFYLNKVERPQLLMGNGTVGDYRTYSFNLARRIAE